MSVLSTREAAEILELEPRQVRKLAASGRLPGRSSPSGWLLDAEAVRQAAANHLGPGRPLAPTAAWQLVTALDVASRFIVDDELDDPEGATRAALSTIRSDRVARHRLAARLRALPEDERLVASLRRRADFRRESVHPGVLARMERDDLVSVGGSTALAGCGAGVAEGAGARILYVAASDVERLLVRYKARPDSAGNVSVAVVPSEVPYLWAPIPGQPVVRAGAMIDVLGEPDARSRYLAASWLRVLRDGLGGTDEARP